MSVELRPIGFVRTDAEELPRHWSVSEVEGTLVIDEEYSEGLRDIEPGQRIVVIFHFHRSPGFSPEFLRQTSGEDGREGRRVQPLFSYQAQPGRDVGLGDPRR